MRLLQGILVYIHEDGSLLLLAGGKQPEGLVHQQVLQAVVCEACKAGLVTNSLQEGYGTPKTSNLQLGDDPDMSWLLGLHLHTHYSICPCCALGFRAVKDVEPYRLSVGPMPQCHSQCLP